MALNFSKAFKLESQQVFDAFLLKVRQFKIENQSFTLFAHTSKQITAQWWWRNDQRKITKREEAKKTEKRRNKIKKSTLALIIMCAKTNKFLCIYTHIIPN